MPVRIVLVLQNTYQIKSVGNANMMTQSLLSIIGPLGAGPAEWPGGVTGPCARRGWPARSSLHPTHFGLRLQSAAGCLALARIFMWRVCGRV